MFELECAGEAPIVIRRTVLCRAAVRQFNSNQFRSRFIVKQALS